MKEASYNQGDIDANVVLRKEKTLNPMLDSTTTITPSLPPGEREGTSFLLRLLSCKALKQRAVLLGVIILGMALRFWGLSWGLPDRLDLHPDEHDHVIRHANSVSWQKPDPIFLNYPSFTCYATALLQGAMKSIFPWWAEWRIYLCGRFIVALFSAFTIPVVFLLARRLGGNATGALLAAGWMALLPLHVWESHITVTDNIMTFWIMLAILFSLDLQTNSKPATAAIAGACVGLATGSKYTAALVCLSPLVAVLMCSGSYKKKLALLLIAGFCALAACFVVTPFSFIRLGDTLAAMSYENAHTRGHHLGFSLPAYGPQYHRVVYQLAAAWPFSLGMPLYLAALCGSLWICFRPLRQKWVLLAFGAAFAILTCSITFTPLRYYTPLLVMGVLFAGMWVGNALSVPGSAMRRKAALAAAIAITLYTAAFTYTTTRRYPNDTRIAADRWILQKLDHGWNVHLFGWHRYAGFPSIASKFLREHKEHTLNNMLKMNENDLIEITSLHFLRWQRHNVESYKALYSQLKDTNSFEMVACFDSPFLNRDFYGMLDPMFRSYFVSPTLEFYRRNPKTLPDQAQDNGKKQFTDSSGHPAQRLFNEQNDCKSPNP